MHKTILALTAATTVLAASAFMPSAASAMTLSTPAGITAAIDDTSLAQDVAYVCRRAWRCGPYGCGWRRHCYWTGPRRPWRGYRGHRYRRW